MLRMLIVDDERAIREALRIFLDWDSLGIEIIGPIVLVEILVQVVEPFLTLVVGSLESDDTEWIDIANLVDIDGAVDAAAQCCIRTDDVGNLESGDIERL